MVSASVPVLGFCFEFLPWLSSVDCDPGDVSQINPSLNKSLLVMVFITPAESKLRQCLFAYSDSSGFTKGGELSPTLC